MYQSSYPLNIAILNKGFVLIILTFSESLGTCNHSLQNLLSFKAISITVFSDSE